MSEPVHLGGVLASISSAHPTLAALASELSRCRVCTDDFRDLGHEPNPVARLSDTAKICVCGQAPGTRVHASGLPFDDRSGDRLRDWMGVTLTQFYDARHIATVPMAFCFPGQDARGGDLPPPAICATQWRARIFEAMPQLKLFLLIGLHAQRWHLETRSRRSLTENVTAWQEHAERGLLPLPHPSWRNNGWLRRNPWFENEVLPVLRERVRACLQV